MYVRRSTVNSYIRSQSQSMREVNCVFRKVNNQQSHQKSKSIFEGGQTVSVRRSKVKSQPQ